MNDFPALGGGQQQSYTGSNNVASPGTYAQASTSVAAPPGLGGSGNAQNGSSGSGGNLRTEDFPALGGKNAVSRGRTGLCIFSDVSHAAFAAESIRKDDFAITAAIKSNEPTSPAGAGGITAATTAKHRPDIAISSTCHSRWSWWLGPITTGHEADTASGTFACGQVGLGSTLAAHSDRREWRPIGAQSWRGSRKDRIGYGKLQVSVDEAFKGILDSPPL